MDIDKLAIIMKDGFDSVDTRFDSIEQELREMRNEFSQQLKEVRNDIENLQQMRGYSKEIDTLIGRVGELEKQFKQKFAS